MRKRIYKKQLAVGRQQTITLLRTIAIWRHYYLLFAAYCILFSACTERMDITTDNATPQLVITGYVTTDTTAHRIQISRTVGYFGTEKPKTYSDAVVEINGMALHSLGEGIYATDSTFYGIAGNTYTLDVWVDFNEDGTPEYYTATTTMPVMHTLDSTTLSPLKSMTSKPAWWPMVHFFNHPGPNDFGVNLYIRDTLYSSKLQRYFLYTLDNSAAENQYIHFPVYGYTIQEEMRWDHGTRFKVYPGDTVTVELNVLSREYYEYIRTAKLEISGGNPLFAGPPANVPGNISGGALGIFGAYTASRKQAVMPPAEDW